MLNCFTHAVLYTLHTMHVFYMYTCVQHNFFFFFLLAHVVSRFYLSLLYFQKAKIMVLMLP